MIVCSCNVITRQDIEAVVRGFLEVDEWQLVTAGMVYHAMEKRGKCCGCFPGAINVIVETVQAFHDAAQTPDQDLIPFVRRIRDEHERCETARMLAQQNKMRSRAA